MTTTGSRSPRTPWCWHRVTASWQLAVASTLSRPAKESEATSSWNDSNGTYAFRYAADDEPERTMTLKGTAMGESLMLDAAADSRTTNTELKVKDYVADTSNSIDARRYKNLRLLVEHVERDILKDLHPPTASAKSTSRSSQGKAETSRLIEGENQPQWQPAQGSGLYAPNQGHDDLYPGGGLGVFPMRPDMSGLMGGVGIPGGGGMLLGPNDPRWVGVGSSQGPYGGEGSLQELDLIHTALLEYLDLSQTDLAEKVEGGHGRGLTCTLMCNISTPSEPLRTGYLFEGGFATSIDWKGLHVLGITESVIDWVVEIRHALSKEAKLQGKGQPMLPCQMLSRGGTTTALRV
eukprot:SM000058S18458  [mRNA]  locus=s58:71897:74613:+ [translate_table: standard]